MKPRWKGRSIPIILHCNTRAENLLDITEKDQVDIVLTNPPFGGKERKEVQQNFPIRTGETAYLFSPAIHQAAQTGRPRRRCDQEHVPVEHRQRLGQPAEAAAGKLLLESCHLHTVLDCPGGTFQGAGVKTVVLFFEKGAPTRKVWHYQLDPGRNMGKTNPLNDDDLTEFVKLQKKFADSDKAACASA